MLIKRVLLMSLHQSPTIIRQIEQILIPLALPVLKLLSIPSLLRERVVASVKTITPLSKGGAVSPIERTEGDFSPRPMFTTS